ncbi:hypothetical protein BDL97_01G086400 [Sphagnum fallax]|nr:hypothetical protein BDL97_01G086400 [Sphagnum fallax]
MRHMTWHHRYGLWCLAIWRSESTFHLLMCIVEEWEVFLPYPYSKSHAVQWQLFKWLFTDFRDCFSQFDYFHVLSQAKHKFELIPPAWLGY